MLLFVSLFVSYLSAQAATVPTCTQRLTDACQYLQAHKGIISTNADGILQMNPLTPTAELLPAAENYYKMQNVNKNNFSAQIKPIFIALKEVLLEKLQTLPASTSYRGRLINRIRAVSFDIGDRERCRRPSRPPIVASYDSELNNIQICPLVSHITAESLLVILAHEFGHATNLCDPRLGLDRKIVEAPENCQNPSTGLLAGNFLQGVHCCTVAKQEPILPAKRLKASVCNRDSETYADYVATVLTNALWERYRNAATRPYHFATDIVMRTIQFNTLRIEAACASSQVDKEYALPFLQTPAAREILACQGFEGNPVCSEAQLSLSGLH